MLGRSQAVELGRRGACVGVNDLGGSPRGGGSDPTMAQVAVDQIRSAGSEAVANTEDIASADGPRLLVEQALDTWGRVDGVVHNAAILRDAHFENVSARITTTSCTSTCAALFLPCRPSTEP
jgi:NAD(P)-dependent dehydrogenase (short-subunit alcohol dehydrogenase family)